MQYEVSAFRTSIFPYIYIDIECLGLVYMENSQCEVNIRNKHSVQRLLLLLIETLNQQNASKIDNAITITITMRYYRVETEGATPNPTLPHLRKYLLGIQ